MGYTRAAFSSPSILHNLSSTPSTVGSSSSNQSALKSFHVTTTSQEDEKLENDQDEKEDSDSEEEEEVDKSSSKALQQTPRPQPLALKRPRSRQGEDQRLSAEWNHSIGIAQTLQVPPRRKSKAAT